MLNAQLHDGGFEVIEILECLVHARESQKRHLVELPQLGQNREPYVVGVELRGAGSPQVFFDLLRELGEVGISNRAALTGLAHSEHDLLARKGLDDAAALYHHETRGFSGAESTPALGALPTPSDGEPVIARTRINDAAVRVPAERAVHGAASLEEARTHGVAVGGQLLGVAEGNHVGGDLGESIPVILNDLLRSQERVRAEPRGEARLTAGW